MRGKPRDSIAKQLARRITPADAGKTNINGFNDNISQDHPRGCGENPMTKRAYRRTLGSPPRMRGKPATAAVTAAAARITPADAGKTKSPPGGIRRARDHPRGCGENLDSYDARELPIGSPPRMRGKLV